MRILSALPALLATSLACASGQMATWSRVQAQPREPAIGATLPEVVAGLFAPTGGEGDHLRVLELRVLRLDLRPWREVDPEEAATAPRVGLLCHRRCQRLEGLGFAKSERTSWMIFRHGALAAYDHGGFAPGCEPRRDLHPAPLALVDEERNLRRYAAQRYPQARPSLEERLQGGLALVGVGRLRDAERALALVTPRIDELEERSKGLFGEEKEDAQRRVAELRTLRAQLVRTLRAARKRAEAGGDAPGSERPPAEANPSGVAPTGLGPR